jgi:hypothetical protein
MKIQIDKQYNLFSVHLSDPTDPEHGSAVIRYVVCNNDVRVSFERGRNIVYTGPHFATLSRCGRPQKVPVAYTTHVDSGGTRSDCREDFEL